jgi:hypothetical protein
MNSEEASTKSADGVNVSVRSVSVNRTSQAGAADHFVSVRVVPDGRDGTTVFARTLHPGEVDLDEPVVFSPALGERLVFRKECRIRIRDVDRLVKPDETGYASVTKTMWTWLHLSGKATPQQVRFALATARRLDGTHLSLATLISALRELNGSEAKQRTHGFRAIATAEVLVVCLNRAIDMTLRCPGQLRVRVSVPPIVKQKQAAVAALRNGFEHIEERASGRKKGKADPDAASIFDQRRLLVDGTLVIGAHTLSVPIEVPKLLVSMREYLVEAIGALCGEWSPLDEAAFGPAPRAPGAG